VNGERRFAKLERLVVVAAHGQRGIGLQPAHAIRRVGAVADGVPGKQHRVRLRLGALQSQQSFPVGMNVGN
jgi:hypothetical protein